MKNNQTLKTWEENRNLGEELLTSVQQMKAGKATKAHQVVVSQAVEARVATGLSQPSFADLIGVSTRTLQEWEQGRRNPSPAAITLLKIAIKHPDVLLELKEQ